MIKKTLITLLLLIVGVELGIILSYWIPLKKEFYNIRAIEFAQWISTIIIAVFITYFISTKISYSVKKKEILYDLLTRFQSVLNEIIRNGYSYIDKPDDDKEREIKRLFKDASIKLSIMIEHTEKQCKVDDSFRAEYLEFKIALTDTPFGKKEAKYSEITIKQIEEKYGLLLNRIYQCKLQLFS